MMAKVALVLDGEVAPIIRACVGMSGALGIAS